MFEDRLNSLYSTMLLPLIAITLAACASSTKPEEAEPIAVLTVNEEGEYVFPEDDWRDEVVCRRVRPVGSHVPKKVCKTRGQMEEDELEALESLGPERTISGSLPTPSPTPN